MSCVPSSHGISQIATPMELPLDGLKLWTLLQTHASNCGETIKVNFDGNFPGGHHSQHLQEVNMYKGNEDHRLKMNHGSFHHGDKVPCSCPMCPMSQDHQKKMNMGPVSQGPYMIQNHGPNHVGVNNNNSGNHGMGLKMPAVPSASTSSTPGSLHCSSCNKKIRNTKKQQQAAARQGPANYCPMCDKCSRSRKNMYNQNNNNVHQGNNSGGPGNFVGNMTNVGQSHHQSQHQQQQHQNNGYNGQFSSRSVTESHLSAHTCKMCKKGFAFKHDLDRHSKASRGECGKQFKCPKCDKYFSNGGNLKRHAMIHSGEKPYSCTVCSKSFRTKTLVSNHIRTHTGEKPFLCRYCDKKFSKSENLKRHVKIHVKHTNMSL